ncbi:MAG TPA: hypothetical protein VH643_40040, partial [Gemmataceae bacterium]
MQFLNLGEQGADDGRASGVWRAISSSVISSDMPFMLRKNRRLARPIPPKPHPGPWPITVAE